MNSRIKVEVWDDDLIKDERISSFYLSFKKIKDKKEAPRWENLYGPPIGAEGEVADMMTKFPDRGSTYRGRVLFAIETHNQMDPKSETLDLEFKFPETLERPQSGIKSILSNLERSI